MAEAKWQAGMRARYQGIMEKRRGQEVRVAVTSSTGLISVIFPDGAVIGVAPNSLKAA